jgi:glutamine synthetase
VKAAGKQHFLFLGHQDLSGILRGRSVPKERHKFALTRGLPWVPANYSIGPTNVLPPDNPFGPMGEIRLVPDADARLALPAFDGKPAFDIVLCDAHQPDSSSWPYCPRSALKAAVNRLKQEAGLTMQVAFEHEFTVNGLGQVAHPAFSASSGRAVSHLAADVMQTLEKSGIRLEQFQAEYGTDQFEISSVPADPLTAADRVVLTQEAIRDGARRFGLHASFIPKPAPNAAGNGVHIHFSLHRDGRPVTAEKDWLTDISAPFVQGILDNAETAVLFTCLSANSYLRLRPNCWVGPYVCAGLRNREAMIRVVPRVADAEGLHPAASLEYRAIDGTANVYLALAALIGAGLDGIKKKNRPVNIDRNPELLGTEERKRLGLRMLPQSLPDALIGFNAKIAATWMKEALVEAYLACRREDARQFCTIGDEEAASILQRIY